MNLAGATMIPASHGQLEAIFREKTTEAARGAALVLHPHPLYGGDMHNKVVFQIARALQELGFSTLRFNFRGVGRSTGSWDQGRGELEDARTALAELRRLEPDPRELLVAGFSFGAGIAVATAGSEPGLDALIAVGVPAQMLERKILDELTVPTLFLHGENDAVAPLAPLRNRLAASPPKARREVVTLPGTGHFFEDSLDELRAAIGQFLS